MEVDDEGAPFKSLPLGGVLALAPPGTVGNFQASFQQLPATTSRDPSDTQPSFSHRPPPIAHFVGATPYKAEYMQAFGFWNYSTDFDVQALGLMGRGRRDETKGCNLEKLNCVGQFAFNGLDVRSQPYFAQLTHPRLTRQEAHHRFLLLEIVTWPEDFRPLAALWVGADRLAQRLGRELVIWNLPCKFGWSHMQTVRDQVVAGLKVAVVQRTCSIGLRQGTGLQGTGLQDSTASGTAALRLVRVRESCCTAFFDMLKDDRHCGTVAEQVYGCTDHVHRGRFEQADLTADDLENAALGYTRVTHEEAHLTARIMHLRLADLQALSASLGALESRVDDQMPGMAAASSLRVAAGVWSGSYHRYRLTESRGCVAGLTPADQDVCKAPPIA